mgnify:CR=1 FL=1|tara:strand:+ start:405 stop:587 length:183 start_codon:yes stop_codon:yes gene_type:complete
MEDYNINFQEIIDAFSIEELSSFSIKVSIELDKRIHERKQELQKEVDQLTKIETAFNACR